MVLPPSLVNQPRLQDWANNFDPGRIDRDPDRFNQISDRYRIKTEFTKWLIKLL